MKKIGLIDSGIGGLTLLKELMDHKVHAEYLYISDSKNVPYGERSQAFMLNQVRDMSLKLIAKKVEVIILACNTLTAETIDTLRLELAVPIVGLEPYINYLNQDFAIDSKMALILTEATFKSTRFQTLLIDKDPEHKIDIYPLKKLAMILESLTIKDFESIRVEVERELMQVEGRGYTHLILGCTHYPIIKNFLESYLDLIVVDSAAAVRNHVMNSVEFITTDKYHDTFLYNSDNSETWLSSKLSELKFLRDIV